MPRHPLLNPDLAQIRDSAFSSLAHRLAAHAGEVYPLHVGDSWAEPPEGCRMEDLRCSEIPGIHRYAPPQGLPALIDAIVERSRARTGVPEERSNVLVTAGATGALGAVAGAILSPGDEVLVPAPYWPLIEGIVRSVRGIPVPVPFFGIAASPESAVELVRERATSRTVAVYLNTPNNPTGRIIPPAWLDALVAWARANELWILSDDVYEDLAYDVSPGSCRARAPERTFSAHSFSKAFAMAGNRCGYVLGPSSILQEARKISTHTCYSTPTASQLAALRALRGPGDAWLSGMRSTYRDLGRRTAERLGVEPPEGSTFLFLDVTRHLDDRGLPGFLEDCVDRGLFVAPGTSFGPYPAHVRVCFTAAAPDVVARGVEVLAQLLGR